MEARTGWVRPARSITIFAMQAMALGLHLYWIESLVTIRPTFWDKVEPRCAYSESTASVNSPVLQLQSVCSENASWMFR